MLALFPLGQIVATPRALAALEKAKQPPTCFLARHTIGTGANWSQPMSQRMSTVCLMVVSDEGGVCRFVFVPPVRHLGKVEIVASRDAFGRLRPGPRSPNQAFEQGRAGQAVGAV